MRAVFDASCNNSGPSLNECLYPGPNLLSKIFNILLRFRFNVIGILADIKQAFLNIEISKEHQDFLRFLWFENTSTDENVRVVVFRFLRVVFGVTSSPFLLNGTIRHHLKYYLNMHRDFVEKFLEDLYVDDTTSGVASVDEGKVFYRKAKMILSEAGFDLRKWTTNNVKLQNYFDAQENIKVESKFQKIDDTTYLESQLPFSKNKFKRVLGVSWDQERDEFVFQFKDPVSLARSLEPTKRNILKISASFYDPLGFISPVTAMVKQIFQILCKDKIEWDEKISDEVKVTWEQFLCDIENMREVRVRRFSFVQPEEKILSVELVGFCDSSSHIYCGVVYLRVVTTVGIRVSFLAAKTKVAPLKPISIPKLELLSCVLLCKLLSQVVETLQSRLKIGEIVCFSDSEVALCWIKGKEKSWKPWVENRVVEIRNVVGREKWFHVSGKINPADTPTRFCRVDVFKEWYKGPELLYEENLCLERFDVSKKLDEVNNVVSKEVKTCVSSFNVCSEVISSVAQNVVIEHIYYSNCSCLISQDEKLVNNVHNVIDIYKYSSLKKLIIVTCYVLKFIKMLHGKYEMKKRNDVGLNNITVDEYKYALDVWIKNEQYILQKELNYEKLKGSLKLFTDDNGFLRLKGRFANSLMDYDRKYPLILRSNDSQFTKLVIADAHEKVLHHGVESTLDNIRSRFWIIKGRKTVKLVLRKCIVCKRYQAKPALPPETPDLPDFRTYISTNCFQVTGLDYAGPLYVKNYERDSASKVYILLFTCASSRAIHLELTPDMKTSAFKRAFQRFISRRGTPDVVVSDNFKTFKSAEIKKFMVVRQIRQKFILPASPWWDGFYERLQGSYFGPANGEFRRPKDSKKIEFAGLENSFAGP